MAVDETTRIYRLLTDASQSTRELKKVNKQMSDFGDSVKRAGSQFKAAIAGLAAGFTVGAFSRELTGAINEMDKFTKEAQRLGVASDELVKLQYAAELSGVSADQLSTGIKTLSRSMQDLSEGKTSDAVSTLEALSIEVKNADGTLKNSSEVIGDVADAFQKMPDGAEKSAAAMRIFGKSGAQMIPLLNQGAEGIAAMGDEAERLGLVFDDEIGRASEQFNDNMTRLSRASDGAFKKIAEGLLPSLIGLTDGLTDGADSSQTFIEIGFKLGQTLEVLTKIFNASKAVVNNFVAVFQAMGKSIGSVIAAFSTGDFKNLPNTLGGIFDEMAKQVDENGAKIETAWIETLDIMTKDGDEEIKKLKERFAKSDVKMNVELNIASNISDNKKAEAEAKKLEQSLKTQAEKLTESVKTPFEVLQDELAKIKTLSDKGLITPETELRATTDAWKDYGEALVKTKEEQDKITDPDVWKQMQNNVDSWASGATDAFLDFTQGADNAFSDLANSILEQIAKIVIQANIIKPLMSAFGLTESAKGNVFNQQGITPFAQGGIVSSPTLFSYAGGLGVMGESGSEAVIPLTRTSNGDLGVRGEGFNTEVNIYNQTDGNVSVKETKTDNGPRIDVLIEKAVDGAISRGRFDKSLNSHFGLRRRGA